MLFCCRGIVALGCSSPVFTANTTPPTTLLKYGVLLVRIHFQDVRPYDYWCVNVHQVYANAEQEFRLARAKLIQQSCRDVLQERQPPPINLVMSIIGFILNVVGRAGNILSTSRWCLLFIGSNPNKKRVASMPTLLQENVACATTRRPYTSPSIDTRLNSNWFTL